MPSTTDTADLKGIFGLFKGDSGTGKSVGALSFPDPYVFDHDRKMPAIALKHFPGKRVDWDNFPDIFGIGEKLVHFLTGGRIQELTFEYKQNPCKTTYDALIAETNRICPYKTLIGDSVTSLSYTALKTIDDVKGADIFTMLNNTKATKGNTKTIELRGYDYYNGEDSFLKYYLDRLKELWARPGNPNHVILIAHVLSVETTDIKTKMVTKTRRIVTAGKNIAAYIIAQFDDAYHFGLTEEGFGDTYKLHHLATTEAVGDDSAKTSYRLPGKIDFTDGSLYEIMRVNGLAEPSHEFIEAGEPVAQTNQ